MDELRIHLAPVLLGAGVRLFDQVGPELALLYLVYANGWGYLLWKLNRPSAAHVDVPAA